MVGRYLFIFWPFISLAFLIWACFFVIVHTNEYTYANNREQNYYYYYYMSYNMYIYVVQYAKLNKIKDKGNNTFEAPSTRLNTLWLFLNISMDRTGFREQFNLKIKFSRQSQHRSVQVKWISTISDKAMVSGSTLNMSNKHKLDHIVILLFSSRM